jgi:hypothetical protein
MNVRNLFGVDTIGAIKGNQFKPSMMGLAIKNDAGDYVVFDPKTNTITNVADMVFDGFDTVFAIPTPVVAVGDLILRGSEPLYIKAINDDESITVINPVNDRQENYLPQKTLFGFRVYVKVFSLFGSIIPTANGDGNVNGLSGMLPFLLMSGGLGEGGDMKDILPLMLFGNLGGGNIFGGTTGDENKDQANLMNTLMFMTLFSEKKDKGAKSFTKAVDVKAASATTKSVVDRETYVSKVKARLHSLPSSKEAIVRKEIDRRKKAKGLSVLKWEEVEDVMNLLGV